MTTSPEQLSVLLGQARQQHVRSIPGHVIRRLAYFVASADVQFVDVAVQPTDDGLTGRICIFTPHLVVVADLLDASSMDRSGPSGAVSTDVTAWPRSALESVTLSGGDGLNTDSVWQQDWGAGNLPPRAQLELNYKGGRTIGLPSAPQEVSDAQEEALRVLVPALLGDL